MIKSFTTVVLSLAILFPVFDHEAPAEAATCAVAGGQSGRLTYSGQVTKISATVCGNQLWKILGKSKKPVKRVRSGKPKKYDNKFTVVPDQPKLLGVSHTEVGQTEKFQAVAIRHTRNRLLFWYPAQVRFIPKTFQWNFGDQTAAESKTVEHSWSRRGSYWVKVIVGYSVRYRIIGHSTWISLPGLVYSSSPPWLVDVGANSRQNTSKVVLVHWTCLEKLFAIGC